MYNDPNDETQRAREERFDRFLDIADGILHGTDGDGDVLGDDPDYDTNGGDGTEVFEPGGGDDGDFDDDD